MNLAAYINNFYRKYKKLLAILVLVFFVYKVFDYYTTVYEGFVGGIGGRISPSPSQPEPLPQVDKFRRKAEYTQKQAEQIRRDAETMRNKLENNSGGLPLEEYRKLESEVYTRFQEARDKALLARTLGQQADDAEKIIAGKGLLM
jgi:hypothetical protein